MLFLAALVCCALSFVIAAVTVGGTVSSLERRPRRIRYDVEDASVFIADNLPSEVTSQISYDDVAAVIDAQLAYLGALGMASGRSDQDIVEELRIVDDTDSLAFVLGELERNGRDISDDYVVAVLDAEAAYRRQIGMTGPEIGSIDD